MPATRKTRSGRPAPAPPSKRIRTKGGCLTCRIRRKKCDESRDHEGGCVTCARLRIQCLGYSNKRPEWLKGTQVDGIKRQIKHFLADHSAKSSSRSSDDAFLVLHTPGSRTTLPRQSSDSEHSDTDSEPDLKPSVPTAYEYSSPADSYFEQEPMPWTWSPVDPLPQPWDSSYDFYTASYIPPGNEEQENCPYGMPELVDLSMDMLSDVLVTAPYEHYSPQPELLELFFNMLRINYVSDSDRPAVIDALQNDPEAALMLVAASQQDSLYERGQATLEALANVGYDSDRSECRALVYLCMMKSSLIRGDPGIWGECLNRILGWTKGVYSEQGTPHLPDSQVSQLILKNAMWADIIAGATEKRQPFGIDVYRQLLSTEAGVLDDCPNKTALAMAETVALAAHADQLRRASRNLEDLRKELPYPTEGSSPSKAAVHTAGARLYLEVTAHRGAVGNPDIEEAARRLCALASQTDQPRDFAFWVFLAGCNTTNLDLRRHCHSMLSAESSDGSVNAAMRVMENVWHACEGPNFQPDMWKARMNEQGLLLV